MIRRDDFTNLSRERLCARAYRNRRSAIGMSALTE